MKFNSPLQRLSCMRLNYRKIKIMLYQFPMWGIEIVSTMVEMKSCYTISPHVENWNFTCNIGMSILHQGEKILVKFHIEFLIGNSFFTTCGFTTRWKIHPFFSSVKDWVNPFFSLVKDWYSYIACEISILHTSGNDIAWFHFHHSWDNFNSPHVGNW